MKKVTSLSFALIAVLLTPGSLLACQCVAPVLDTEEDFRAAVSDSLGRSDAVFSGEVIEADRFTIKFKVRELWKGEFKEEVTLITGAYVRADGLVVSSRCGPQFESGKSYLVFARGPGDQLQAERCPWTGDLGGAGRVVDELNRLRRTETDPQFRKARGRADSFPSWRDLTAACGGRAIG